MIVEPRMTAFASRERIVRLPARDVVFPALHVAPLNRDDPSVFLGKLPSNPSAPLADILVAIFHDVFPCRLVQGNDHLPPRYGFLVPRPVLPLLARPRFRQT